ncbi:39S ribosomal protein L9, mitochondrial-like [Daphnia pulicaria]|uniref:39S ribosomal protein L9, mitochondrial-like n=1 Tax=Daphnia pulicaria TaxID=35523 RepID=UPI001EEBFE84|nr:39S ribosomal protein L9, mitochondrial-like [Daphnia pulicaria]
MIRLGFQLLGGAKSFQPSLSIKVEQIRTTFVLKRRYPPLLDKQNRPPKPLVTKNFVYDEVENANLKKEPDLKLILTSFVEGVGLKNEIVTVRPNFGRFKLLASGLAVYASPENLEKLKKDLENSDNKVQTTLHSSRFAELTRRDLASKILVVLVNQENPWTIEKWHIRAAFRRTGIWVPDNAIKMGDKPISGPNLELEKKYFLVTVTINNLETTPVRCMIRHWSTFPELRLPKVDGYLEPPYEPIFEDDREIISTLPLPVFCLKKSVAS